MCVPFQHFTQFCVLLIGGRSKIMCLAMNVSGQLFALVLAGPMEAALWCPSVRSQKAWLTMPVDHWIMSKQMQKPLAHSISSMGQGSQMTASRDQLQAIHRCHLCWGPGKGGIKTTSQGVCDLLRSLTCWSSNTEAGRIPWQWDVGHILPDKLT